MEADENVARWAEAHLGLIERSRALACGLSSSGVDRRVASGRLVAVHPRVYRFAGVPETWHQRLSAACLAAGPGAVASHRSAARLWGLLDTDVVEITVPRRRSPRLDRVVVHRSLDVRQEHLALRQLVPTTNPLLTVVDLGAVVPPSEVEDVLDRGATARLYTVLGVEAVLDQVAERGRPGVGVLRTILDRRALGRDRADGLLEPRMARLLRAHSLPPARFQHVVRGGRGRFAGRVDFAYPERRLAIEVDGYEVHGTPRAMEEDFVRQAKLLVAGWMVVRFTWHQVVRQPALVAASLRAVLTSLPPT